MPFYFWLGADAEEFQCQCGCERAKRYLNMDFALLVALGLYY